MRVTQAGWDGKQRPVKVSDLIADLLRNDSYVEARVADTIDFVAELVQHLHNKGVIDDSFITSKIKWMNGVEIHDD